MMDSFLPVLEDRAEAITTLDGLVHETRVQPALSDSRLPEIWTRVSRSTGQSSLSTGVKNLFTVIRRVNRRGHRPILYSHHTILSHEEVRPTPVMRSCPTAF